MVVENISLNSLKSLPKRIALPDAPAPTSKELEKNYYINVDDITKEVKKILLT